MSDFDKYAQMAKEGTLPEGFNKWDLKNNEGVTVKDVAKEFGHLKEENPKPKVGM